MLRLLLGRAQSRSNADQASQARVGALRLLRFADRFGDLRANQPRRSCLPQSEEMSAQVAPGKLCKLCRRKRPFDEFVWQDANGRLGVSQRCVTCRNRGKRPDPNLPLLRHNITRHAVMRYVERVRPEWLDRYTATDTRGEVAKAARLEMRKLMAYAPFEREWPAWVGEGRHPHGDESVGFLRIDADTIFLLSGDPNGTRVVVTVLTRQKPDD